MCLFLVYMGLQQVLKGYEGAQVHQLKSPILLLGVMFVLF